MNAHLDERIRKEYSCFHANLLKPESTYKAGAEAMAEILLPLLTQALPAIALQICYLERQLRNVEDIEKVFDTIRQCLEPKHLPDCFTGNIEKRG
jgi:hypothetical protein